MLKQLLFARPVRALAGLTVLAGSVTLLTAAKPVPPRTAAPRVAGVTFKYRITSTNPDKRQREARAMFADVRMADGNVRMDYLEGMSPTGQKGGYILMQGASGRMVVVNPKDKQALVMTPEAFGSGLGALMNMPGFKMTMSNTSFRYRDLGAGEPILGYKTRKVRTWYTSTMELKAMMMPDQKVTTSDSSDQWIATNLPIGTSKSFEAWGKSFGAGVKSTNPALAAEMAKYTAEYAKTGMALKTVTWSTSTDKKGKVTADTLTMEVTELKSGDIDPSVFEIPKGYEVVDLGQAMAGASAAMDSARAAEKGEGEAKAEEKPSAKDALKKGLGGFLKKKPPV